MRILLVKTSSLGDVIHNLPVAADIARTFPDAIVDWCVEESFADIPSLSPAIRQCIPVAIRRWRKMLFSESTRKEIGTLRKTLKSKSYDVVLDTQGLLKSALITRQANGRRLGYTADSAREPVASIFYDGKHSVPRALHAVVRNRQLAAAALGYAVPDMLDYGISAPSFSADWLPSAASAPLVILLTATSRDDKLWEEENWVALGQALSALGLIPVLPAGNTVERNRAARIVAQIPGAIAAPALPIHALAGIIGQAHLTIGVDTGLVHLAAALRVPTIALYTATDPTLTGVLGAGFFRNLGGKGCSPSADKVLSVAKEVLNT